MIKLKKKKQHKYYKKLFKERFGTELNKLNEMSSLEFFRNLINEIEKQYNKEIKRSNEPVRYIEKEKIRLQTKIEMLKSRDFDITFKYLSVLYSLIIPIIIAVIGYVFVSAKSMVDFAIQNKIEQLRNDNSLTNINDVYDFLTNTYSDYNLKNVNFIGYLQFTGILVICLLFLFMIIREIIRKENNSKIVAFERMCLDILEGKNIKRNY